MTNSYNHERLENGPLPPDKLRRVEEIYAGVFRLSQEPSVIEEEMRQQAEALKQTDLGAKTANVVDLEAYRASQSTDPTARIARDMVDEALLESDQPPVIKDDYDIAV